MADKEIRLSDIVSMTEQSKTALVAKLESDKDFKKAWFNNFSASYYKDLWERLDEDAPIPRNETSRFYGEPSCLTGDSRVLLEDGSYPTIKELIENRPIIALPSLSISNSSGNKLVLQPITDYLPRGKKKIIKITTSSGRFIKITSDHLLIKGNKNQRKDMSEINGIRVTKGEWAEAQTFKEGDFIGVPNRLSIFGNEAMPEHEIKILAYLIVEGGLTKGETVFTNKDRLIIEDFNASINSFSTKLNIRESSRNVSQLSVTQYKQYSGEFWKYHTQIRQFLDTHELSTNLYNKRVPEAIFKCSKRLISLFLNRLFSCDGYYGESSGRIIGYTSMSEQLIHDIQHFLIRFGISSRIQSRITKYETISYELLISHDRDIDQFIEEIGFFGEKYWNIKKQVSYRNNQKKARKGGNQIRYDSIKSIEELPEEETYDLTIANTHNFIANDLYVHNCGKSWASLFIAYMQREFFNFSYENLFSKADAAKWLVTKAWEVRKEGKLIRRCTMNLDEDRKMFGLGSAQEEEFFDGFIEFLRQAQINVHVLNPNDISNIDTQFEVIGYTYEKIKGKDGKLYDEGYTKNIVYQKIDRRLGTYKPLGYVVTKMPPKNYCDAYKIQKEEFLRNYVGNTSGRNAKDDTILTLVWNDMSYETKDLVKSSIILNKERDTKHLVYRELQVFNLPSRYTDNLVESFKWRYFEQEIRELWARQRAALKQKAVKSGLMENSPEERIDEMAGRINRKGNKLNITNLITDKAGK